MINKKYFNIGFHAIASFLLILTAPLAYAYGDGGSNTSSSSCRTVKFYKESPAPKAEIPELSNFSFVVSSDTNPSTIEVEIRDQKGKYKVTEQPDGSFLVEGKIPKPITEEKYARIDIFATTKSGCSSHRYYLVKITGENQQKEGQTSGKDAKAHHSSGH